MKYSWIILLCLLNGPSNAAQDDDLAVRVQDSYRKAKTKADTDGITMWCKDQIVAMNFKEHDRVMVLALKAMQEDKVEEANIYLKKARVLDELSDNLGAIVCRKK
jgi:flagellin-specific chaperone FliS